MGSGCFRPPTSLGDIDLSVLDAIYEDFRNTDAPTHNDQKSQLIYRQVKEKIVKKGQLRKLCDYLSSHRSRICDTVLHSYRITNQSKTHVYKYVAVIVIEAIFNSIPKGNPSMYRSSKAIAMTQVQASYHEPSKKVVTEMSEGDMKKSIHNNIAHQITSYKFQSIYFNFVCLLIKENGFLYRLVLENLMKFCEFSDDPFNNQVQVLEIMKCLNSHIQNNDNLAISLKTYSSMLQRVRQSYFVQNSEILKNFMQLWTINSSDFLSDHQANRIELSETSLNIIQIFMKKCIQSYQYDSVIQAVFNILDSKMFTNIQTIQNLLQDTVQNIELKDQFNKSIIIYLMAYVGFPESNQISNLNNNIYRKFSKMQQNTEQQQIQSENKQINILQKQWTESYKLGNANTFKSKYKNIKSAECKFNSLSCIAKWIYQIRTIQISELLTYFGNNLINAFVINMYSHNESVKNKAKHQLINFIGKIDSKYNVQILDLITSQLEQSPIFDENIRQTFLQICSNIISKQKQINVPSNAAHIIQTINSSYSFESIVKILQINGQIFTKINKQCCSRHVQKICDFYSSILHEITNGYSNCQQKIQLVQQIDRNYNKIPYFFKGIHIAFLELIQQNEQKQNSPQALSQNQLFFVDFFLLRVSKLAGIQVKSQHIQNYTQKLKKSKDFAQLDILEEYSKDRVSVEINIQLKDKQNLDYYYESISFFRKNQVKQFEQNATGSVFWRDGKSINSNRDSMYSKDKDLEDVLDVLKND